MGLFSFFGVSSPAHMIFTRIFSRAKFVGADSFGNKYYKSKPRKGYKHERRFVKYKGAPEASKIPPEWHGWMHHQTDIVPSSDTKSFRRVWQKPHTVNKTGTDEAYNPLVANESIAKTTGDYEAWNPSKSQTE